MRFVDTNILLYAVSTAPGETRKAGIARSILEAGDLALSVQVLQEFYVQATRPSKRDRLEHEQAALLMESFLLQFRVLDVSAALVRAALDASQRFRISYWDAAIIEAARAINCPVVLTEDLQHGQNLGGVRVVDPFRTSARR